jgi:decaprenylphospho-beta-D-ribofuranose 2-oxidase
MSSRAVPAEFASFDGSTRIRTHCFTPDRYRFWDARDGQTYGISRGAGLSYTAASFSSTAPSINHFQFNRLLNFDSDSNLLEVEAGATLGHIYDFAVQRNLFLSVQPGHPRITVGGCIGADVHGKNQFRDGTFLSRIESLRLFHPDHGILEVSREKAPELFALTCGGYGLTGNILSARIRLTALPCNRVRLNIRPVSDAFGLVRMLPEAAAKSDLVYTWHDFMSRGTAFGRGFLITGSFSTENQFASEPPHPLRKQSRLTAESRSKLSLPFFNCATTRVFNAIYRAMLQRQPAAKLISLYEFLFPVHNKEIYFRLFGTRGFQEYQMIVPAESFYSLLRDLQRHLEQNPLAITLASAKLFRGRRELLRFTGDGICLALDFPRGPSGLAFAGFLDQLMRSYGGWPNIIKDSRLTPVLVSETYPGYHDFRDGLRQFDPRRLYGSELSQRLAL